VGGVVFFFFGGGVFFFFFFLGFSWVLLGVAGSRLPRSHHSGPPPFNGRCRVSSSQESTFSFLFSL